VILTVPLPVVAVPEAISVSVLLFVVGLGLKVALTPDGNRLAPSETERLKPPLGTTVIVLVPVVAWAMLRTDGLADKEKFGADGAETVREMVVVLVRLPLVPVIVTAAVPVLALLEAAKVSVLVLVGEVELKLAVTPEGRPRALRETVPVNPLFGVTVMVLVQLAP
jgi:hypothetical protein